jgi:hypothetical protein
VDKERRERKGTGTNNETMICNIVDADNTVPLARRDNTKHDGKKKI